MRTKGDQKIEFYTRTLTKLPSLGMGKHGGLGAPVHSGFCQGCTGVLRFLILCLVWVWTLVGYASGKFPTRFLQGTVNSPQKLSKTRIPCAPRAGPCPWCPVGWPARLALPGAQHAPNCPYPNALAHIAPWPSWHPCLLAWSAPPWEKCPLSSQRDVGLFGHFSIFGS